MLVPLPPANHMRVVGGIESVASVVPGREREGTDVAAGMQQHRLEAAG